ncbi:MAG: tRNA pseudouridine(54/55) synthase Pus10 [Candidatus Aenigmarchaeota archaeon]|nr:tRNA pseudouridine(54/55) synthase Pus10 [Candidatus Aenigmarchaeota archaeon]
MELTEKLEKLMEYPICDHCLGRQFGQLLHGYTNKERGKILRAVAAMILDTGEKELKMYNFPDFKFHHQELSQNTEKSDTQEKCSVCDDIFDNLSIWIDKIKKIDLEYKTFLIGTKLSFDLIRKEENTWDRVGIDWCEPLKAEINREVGKLVEKTTGKKFELKNPDINFILDMKNNKLEVIINPLFIYGEYQKLKRGIPQTKWPENRDGIKLYKTSVEEIIAKPIMKFTKGKGHKFHGLGREDIDARCFGWRPFVLEILEPKKRLINLKNVKIPKSVHVRNMRFSDTNEVTRIKEKRSEKTYEAEVILDKPIEKKDLEKLKLLIGEIYQRTPNRVLHRRGDLKRKRKLISLKTIFINSKKFRFIVRGEAGLYIKELINGDNGRTRPSVSEILNRKAICKNLDVVGIHV